MYTLPSLPYAYDALEPYIDAKTMEIHHTKHHQAYIDKLNAVLNQYPAIQSIPLETLLKTLDTLDISDADKKTLRNNGGGHLNHSLFWEIMNPTQQGDQTLQTEIIQTFGSLDAMKQQFTQHALTQFGSGWSWLVRTEQGALALYSTPNQDSPYMKGHTPILGLDVWEHAYYLHYQNKRADYITAWWNTIKWI